MSTETIPPPPAEVPKPPAATEVPEPPPTPPIDPAEVRLFYSPPGTPRMTVGNDRSYHTIKLFQAWPLSNPGKHLCFQDGRGEEILTVPKMEDLPAESRPVAEEELRRRYLTARVEVILSVRTEFGVTYWNVRTDRGERDFVVQSVSESCAWLSDSHILITDVDGNRFEILDINALDTMSRAQLDTAL